MLTLKSSDNEGYYVNVFRNLYSLYFEGQLSTILSIVEMVCFYIEIVVTF